MKNSLHYRLRASHTVCQKSIVSDLKSQTDLKPGEPKIIEFLAENQPCEQKEIAAGCDIDPASVTGLLRRMENHNLIERHIKNGNRRSLYVSLTDFGIEMAKKVENTFNKVDSKALNGFSDSEIELLDSMLDRIYENLK